ncbi:unnamed protein product [Sphagnum troendelagicum]|uniref:Nodulin-like domain-containing protein n=1 Tax=Sphagnum troendelagicum TaxID=128251 RepID=A0ABP0U4U6_9BRYO
MGISRVKRILKDRWLGLCLGMWMQACGGISYVFSLYSADLKHTLGYNQEMIDGFGTSKDIGGNVGIISGLLIDVTSAWFVLLVGGLLHFIFYFLLFLAATGRITPSYWQMCGIIMIGTNGATWFNTAVLVTCMRNFPSDRGVVVGLLKGFIGLSGAIFTQVYTAMYAPNTGPFLLLCATVPPLVAMVSMIVIRPIEAPKRKDDTDKSKFSTLYVSRDSGLHMLQCLVETLKAYGGCQIVGIVLAFYLMAVILIQVSWFLLVFESYRSSNKQPMERKSPSLQAKSATTIDVSPKSLENLLDSAKVFTLDTPSKHTVKLGHDHTLLQAATTQDYWLLFFAMGCGTGSGLTAINNLAQMAESLGSRSVGAFVALVSVWNFLGRMGSGFASESTIFSFAETKYATPRPLFLLFVQVVMAVAHLLFASSVPALLYLASILVGLAHGAHWTLMVATSSELFGLKHFGALYNTLSISATVGSYLLSVKLAGYIYDRQLATIQAAALATGKILTGPQKCIGPQCFRSTFLVMAGVCGLGCLALSCLVARTRKVYKDLYKLQQAKDHLTSKGSSTELHTTHITSGDQTCEDATLTDSPVLKANGILEPKRHRHLAQSRMDNLE